MSFRNAIGFFVKSGGGTVIDPDLVTYMTGLVTPLSAGQVTLLQTFITNLKTGLGITRLYDAFDALWIFAGETQESSLRNLVKRAHDAEPVNSSTFNALEGFTGNRTNMYLKTNWNGRNDGANYKLNDCSAGFYFRTFDRSGIYYHGTYSTAADGGINNGIIVGSGDTANLYFSLNSSLSSIITDSTTNGFYIQSRTSSANFTRNRNKVKNTVTTSSSKIPDQELVVLARRTTNTTVGLFNASQISMLFLGKGFNDTQNDFIIDTFEAYMDANGKGII